MAIPIVAIVDQLLPVAKETTAQTTQVANKKIVGIFSDGDLRRQLQKNIDINNVQVSKVMTRKFKSIESEKLVVDAAKFMKKNKVYYLAVNRKNKIQGFITMHEILEANVL